MRILVLTFYYRPDLSAGSFRTTALVAELAKSAPTDATIDVITTLPNRYESYAREAAEREQDGRVTVHRIRIPKHRSDMIGQSLAFAHFAREAYRLVAENSYDLVFATSSRLMTAALGARIARRKRAKLYLDIRDLFVDTIKDVLPSYTSLPAKAIFGLVERMTTRRADRINLVSRGFESYFEVRYPHRSLAWFTNGIDDEFLVPCQGSVLAKSDHRITILYAGNIGEGQGLHNVLPGLASALRARARFIVIGDGGRLSALQRAIEAEAVDNVEIRGPMPRSQLIQEYAAADVLFMHLNAHDAFERVLPSKIFEYAALGKPILAGVSGFAARFIREEVANAAVFSPCDVSAAVAALAMLELKSSPRREFVAKYARTSIANAMAKDVLSLLQPP